MQASIFLSIKIDFLTMCVIIKTRLNMSNNIIDDNLENLEPDPYLPKSVLTGNQIVLLLNDLLIQLNNELGLTCEQTAFLATTIAMNDSSKKDHSLKNIFLISLFHLIGVQRFFGEKYTCLSSLTPSQKGKCFIYAYSYLKHMSPLGDAAKALIYYDKKYNPILAEKIPQIEDAALIFDAQKILFMLRDKEFNYTDEDLENLKATTSTSKYVEIFKNIDSEKNITKQLKIKTYKESLSQWNDTFKYTEEETISLLKMLIYVMDFKSTQTVRHTINTASYATTIGELAGCSTEQINKLYTAALLHDLGKMAIPESILESSTTLSMVEFTLMKAHVEYTIKLLQNVIPEDVFNIAVRHHEKLNGTGYPYGLTAKDLSIEERILTIADIVSALIDSRTYKTEFSKEKVIEICNDMANKGQVDKNITEIVLNNFEKLKEDASFRNKFMSAPLGLVEMLFHEEMDYESLEQPA